MSSHEGFKVNKGVMQQRTYSMMLSSEHGKSASICKHPESNKMSHGHSYQGNSSRQTSIDTATKESPSEPILSSMHPRVWSQGSANVSLNQNKMTTIWALKKHGSNQSIAPIINYDALDSEDGT